jgi:hypothetical protein
VGAGAPPPAEGQAEKFHSEVATLAAALAPPDADAAAAAAATEATLAALTGAADLDGVAVAIFSLEYFMRLYACVEEPGFKGALSGRWRQAKSPSTVIDLLAILPFFLEVFLHHLLDLRFLRVFRLTRLLKLTRGNDATATLGKVIAREWPVIAAAAFIMLLLVVLMTVGLRMALKQEAFRLRFDAAWLRLPLIGRLATGYNAARFAGTLGMLASAGVPILKALQTAAETLSNRAMRADALEALVLVREGAPLAMALSQKKRFPGLLPMFARLGEQTGQLPLMLQRAGKQLSTEVQRRALALATILEPLLIVAMGGVVMVMVLAVLMPIIELNQWVK